MLHNIFFCVIFWQLCIIVIRICKMFNRILQLNAVNIQKMADGKTRNHLFNSQNSQQKNRSPFSYSQRFTGKPWHLWKTVSNLVCIYMLHIKKKQQQQNKNPKKKAAP